MARSSNSGWRPYGSVRAAGQGQEGEKGEGGGSCKHQPKLNQNQRNRAEAEALVASDNTYGMRAEASWSSRASGRRGAVAGRQYGVQLLLSCGDAAFVPSSLVGRKLRLVPRPWLPSTFTAASCCDCGLPLPRA